MRLLPLLCSLLASTVVLTQAQAQTPPTKPAVKTSTKASKPAKPKEPQEPAELDAERMAVAPMVLHGESKCEFGQRFDLKVHPSLPGRFLLQHRGINHVLTPQPTTTGVVRLEDKRTGYLWLQVPIKSMLMDGKKGQRIADNCMHPTQMAEVAATEAIQAQPSSAQ
jgi:hypothetical protein